MKEIKPDELIDSRKCAVLSFIAGGDDSFFGGDAIELRPAIGDFDPIHALSPGIIRNVNRRRFLGGAGQCEKIGYRAVTKSPIIAFRDLDAELGGKEFSHVTSAGARLIRRCWRAPGGFGRMSGHVRYFDMNSTEGHELSMLSLSFNWIKPVCHDTFRSFNS